jgi:AcrR family transcriptional regulator
VARDVEETKRRVREAAIAEFAEHGRHGTTIERIAARAGVNRERVYHYFGDKAALFGAVVREEAEKVAAAVPPRIERPEDFGELAGRAFDYQQAHPDLVRLVLWEGLADTGAVADEPGRGAHYGGKVEAIAAAQREGLIDDAVDPAHLVFLLLALASWWDAAPQIARMLSGADAADPDERMRRRAAVVEAARRLAWPRDPPAPDG